MVLLIDNYDSFTYNLAQYIEQLGLECRVVRNDAVTLAGIESLAPQAIVISPGPSNPDSAGITLQAIAAFSVRVPMLGVCLGHQAMGQAFGGKVVRAPSPRHGKVSPVAHDGRGVFAGLPSPMNVARYHSLIVAEESLPDCLEVSARSPDGLIMALRHRTRPSHGVQFHPESIASDSGLALLRNFFKMAAAC